MIRFGSVALACGIVAVASILARAEELPKTSHEEANARHMAELRKSIAGREREPAEKVFKDVKTFKGWTAEALLDVMDKGFSPSLGVACTFCHTDADWIVNGEHKTIARGMWTMMIETNKRLREITWGEGSVNCYTCHRGRTDPVSSPEQE